MEGTVSERKPEGLPSMNPGEADNEVYQQVVQSIMLAGLNGVPNLKFRSAAELAKDYKRNKKYRDDHHRVRDMIY